MPVDEDVADVVELPEVIKSDALQGTSQQLLTDGDSSRGLCADKVYEGLQVDEGPLEEEKVGALGFAGIKESVVGLNTRGVVDSRGSVISGAYILLVAVCYGFPSLLFIR